MWPQCGVPGTPHIIPPCSASPLANHDPQYHISVRLGREQARVKRVILGLSFRPFKWLTADPRQDYINPYGAPSAFGAMTRLRSTSLIFGDPSFRSLSEAWSFDGSPACREWDRHGSGLFDK
jgi:hypothetical protein